MNRGMRGLQDAGESILRTPGRSGLAITVLGIGFAALLVLFAAREGLAEKEAAILRDFGASSLSWVSDEETPFQERHLEQLRAGFAPWVFSGKREDRVPESYGTPFTRIWEVDPSWWDDRRDLISRGRFFDATDHSPRTAVAAPGLVPANEPLPYHLQVFPHPLTIVGESTLLPGGTVAIPRNGSLLWSGASANAGSEIHEIRVTLQTGVSHAEAVARLKAEAPQLGISPAAVLRSPEEVLRPLVAWRKRMHWILGGIAAIALGLGAVGIGGIFALSVRERFPEIGLRRALGATPFHIACWFLTEVTLMALVAACVFGLVTGVALHALQPTGFLHWRIDGLSIGAALAGILGTALAAAGVPARVAATLSPARVLRND